MKKRVKQVNPNRRKTKQGYIQIRLDFKWEFEHRLVVENFIGRILEPEEVVHHIDFNKSNNSINNLMIFPSQKEHSSFHIYFSKYGFNQRTRRIIQNRWINCHLPVKQSIYKEQSI